MPVPSESRLLTDRTRRHPTSLAAEGLPPRCHGRHSYRRSTYQFVAMPSMKAADDDCEPLDAITVQSRL